MGRALRVVWLAFLSLVALAVLTVAGCIALQLINERHFDHAVTPGRTQPQVLAAMGHPDAKVAAPVKPSGLSGQLGAPSGAFASQQECTDVCQRGAEVWRWRGVADQRFGAVFDSAGSVIFTWHDY